MSLCAVVYIREFFFFKQKTAYDMRISDWSSDVCSSDLDYPLEPPLGRSGRPETGRQAFGIDAVNEFDPIFEQMYDWCEAMGLDVDTLSHEIGRASCRERVCQFV